MIPRRLVPLCCALAVLISSGSPAHGQITVKRVVHVTITGVSSPHSAIDGVYELWSPNFKGNESFYRYNGWVDEGWMELTVTQVNADKRTINVVFTHGNLNDGIYQSVANSVGPVHTCTYTTKQSYMPTTVTVEWKDEPDAGGGGGSVSISNFGSDPTDIATPTTEPDLPDPDAETAPELPTYTFQFPADPFSGGTESEYPTPQPGDIEIAWNPLDLPTIEDDFLTFNVPMPDILVAHGAPYIVLSTDPYHSFGAGPGGIFQKVDLVRQLMRTGMAFVAFVIFARSIFKILVFA